MMANDNIEEARKRIVETEKRLDEAWSEFDSARILVQDAAEQYEEVFYNKDDRLRENARKQVEEALKQREKTLKKVNDFCKLEEEACVTLRVLARVEKDARVE